MRIERTVEIAGEFGQSISIPLSIEGEREAAILTIDGVHYHLERIAKEQLVSDYRVDSDPDYEPQADAEGGCYILAPFSK